MPKLLPIIIVLKKSMKLVDFAKIRVSELE
jgi:hypothetical protein